MDYRINNEAIVACVIAQVVKRGLYDIPFVVGVVNLLMQKKYRKKALVTTGDNVNELTVIFGQLDGCLLGVILNSMTMLLEGGCLKKAEGKLSLTDTGQKMCDEMNCGNSKMLNEVLVDLDQILFKYECIDLNSLYHQFWIAS
jgi:hypothetical protein